MTGPQTIDLDIQTQRAAAFHQLHDQSDPLVLFNAWDVASATAIGRSTPAVATSSAGVASSLGFADGEQVPLDIVVNLASRLTMAVDKPVSIDFEAGYGDSPLAVASSTTRLLRAGVVGINIEDGLVEGRRKLAKAESHARKIAAAREAADDFGVRLFINARTDPFLLDFGTPGECLAEAVRRSVIYADAGASGIFVPGLTDPGLIAKLVESSTLPVNVMITGTGVGVSKLAAAGVRRISLGPWPMMAAMAAVRETAARLCNGKFAGLLHPDPATA